MTLNMGIMIAIAEEVLPEDRNWRGFGDMLFNMRVELIWRAGGEIALVAIHARGVGS